MALASVEIALLLILLSAVLGFFAFWAWRLHKGIRVRLWFIALFAWFYELLFLLVLEEVLRLPWGRIALGGAILDLVLFAIGLVPGYWYTLRTTRFEKNAKGKWLYRGRIAIPAAWLSLFLLRYGVELALLGRVYLFTPTPSPLVAVPTFAAALIAVDALFAASTGLVMGETVAIWLAYHNEKAKDAGPKLPAGALETVESAGVVSSPVAENPR
jgi:hypothetical protein